MLRITEGRALLTPQGGAREEYKLRFSAGLRSVVYGKIHFPKIVFLFLKCSNPQILLYLDGTSHTLMVTVLIKQASSVWIHLSASISRCL